MALLLLFALAACHAASGDRLPSPAAAARVEASVNQLIMRVYDKTPSRNLERVEKTFIPILGLKTTLDKSDALLSDLKKLMLHVALEHDRRTYYCNALAGEWNREADLRNRSLPVCTVTIDERQNQCALFNNRLSALRRMMSSFAKLYADERMNIGENDVLFWRKALVCEAGITEPPPPEDLRYISDLLVEFSAANLAGDEPLDPKRNQDIAEFQYVAMGRYRSALQNACALSPKWDTGLLRTMECRASGLREGKEYD